VTLVVEEADDLKTLVLASLKRHRPA